MIYWIASPGYMRTLVRKPESASFPLYKCSTRDFFQAKRWLHQAKEEYPYQEWYIDMAVAPGELDEVDES